VLRSRVYRGLLSGLSRLPLGIQHRLGAALGVLFWVLPNRQRCATLINVDLCFCDKPTRWRRNIARQSLKETGKALIETGAIWTWPQSKLCQLVVAERQRDIFQGALDRKAGVIIASPHIGAWELIGVYLGAHYPMLNLYRPPRCAAMEPIVLKARQRFGSGLAPINASGIRTTMKALKSGAIVGMLPDQEPDRDSGVFAPFYGTPACTMTLLGKLARKSGAPIVFCTMKRLRNGYELHYVQPDAEIYSEDPGLSAAASNRSIEQCIAIAPEQYLWSYRRFRLIETCGTRCYSKR